MYIVYSSFFHLYCFKLTFQEYENLLVHADPRHLPVYKTRRCFLYNNQQYQLDIYRSNILIIYHTFVQTFVLKF